MTEKKTLKQTIAGWLGAAASALDPTRALYTVERIRALATGKNQLEHDLHDLEQVMRQRIAEEQRALRASRLHVRQFAAATTKRIADLRRIAQSIDHLGAGDRLSKLIGDIEHDAVIYTAVSQDEHAAPAGGAS